MRNLLQSILSQFSRITESALYLNDLFEFLAMKPDIRDPQLKTPIPSPIKRGFTFENVGFRYQK